MRISIRLALVCVGLVVSGAVKAAAVVDIYSSQITVYKDDKGGPPRHRIKRVDVALPAAKISKKRSRHGLIKVEFRFKDSKRPSLTGWVKKSAVRLDENVKIDIDMSRCRTSSRNATVVTRGVRGSGEDC